MTSTARLALVAQLDAQLVTRLNRLETRRAAGANVRPLEVAILSLAEQSATHLRPFHADAGVQTREVVAYWLAAGQYDAIRTRYSATA
jgi:hypothetical protein